MISKTMQGNIVSANILIPSMALLNQIGKDFLSSNSLRVQLLIKGKMELLTVIGSLCQDTQPKEEGFSTDRQDLQDNSGDLPTHQVQLTTMCP